MQPTTDSHTSLFEELDYRDSDGIEVSLLWKRADNSLSVVVFDTKLDQSLEFPVAHERALDAFRHPFAYAAFQGLAFSSEEPDRELSIH